MSRKSLDKWNELLQKLFPFHGIWQPTRIFHHTSSLQIMKLHKAIKKLKEGYWIKSEIMNIGYIFMESNQLWYTNPDMHFQVLMSFDHDDFNRDWEIYDGPV